MLNLGAMSTLYFLLLFYVTFLNMTPLQYVNDILMPYVTIILWKCVAEYDLR